MASYDAVVNLNVVGTSRLNKVNASINELNKLTLDLNKSLNLLAPGAGKLGDKLRVAFEPIKNFARDATNGVAKFANTLSGAANQAQVFATVLENVNVKAGGFDAQTADVKNLANAWAGASVNLTQYNRRLRELQQTALAKEGLMQLSSGEIVRGTEAGFGQQGPRLPVALGGKMDLPEGVGRLAKPGLRGAQGLLTKPGVADAIIGAGFPALFGGGPGAILGGGLGGLAGGALGGPLGMALSVGLSAVGQQLDASVVKVKAMGDAINAIDTSALRESFIVVNSELDTTVRRLIEAGEIDKARAALAAEVAAQTGASTQAISGITNNTQELFTAWDRFTSAVSTTAGIVATPLLDGITGVLNIISLAAQGANTLLSLFAQAGPILERSLTPLLPFVGIFRFLANKVSEAMPKGVNEEVEKRNAALEEETDNRMYNLILMGKQERIDKRRNRASTAAAQIQNNELDRQEQINALIAKRDQDLRAARKEFAGTDNQQLAVLEKQIQVEFKLNQRLVEREALRKRERLELQQTLDVIRATSAAELGAIDRKEQIRKQDLTLSQAILESGQKLNTLEQNTANSRLKGYQTQLQFSTSLNETYAIYGAMSQKVNEIAATQQESARQEAEMTKLRADASVREAIADAERASVMARAAKADKEALRAAGELTALKEVELNNIIAQEDIAERNIGITRETAKLAKEDAAAQLVTAKVLIEINRLEEQRAITVQKVAAYAAEAARQTEAFNRAANEATNALNNRLKVSDALTQAALQINNIEIQGLQNKLAQAQTEGERLDILDNIRDLEIANAALTLQATRTQIQAEVERQRIAMSMAEVKYKELQAVVQLAAAQKVLTQSHLEALRAQASALQIARDNYATSVKVADAQMMAANAVYNASVNAANLRVQMEGTAAAAGAVAGAMDRVAVASTGGGGGGGGFLTAANIKNPILRQRAEETLADIDRRSLGAFSTLATMSRKQDVVLEYMAIEKRAAKEQQMQSAAQELESMGLGHLVPAKYRASDSDALFKRFGSAKSDAVARMSSANPQVTITTGPVMQMDGTNYVTQRDLVSATGTAARQGAKMALEMLQNNPASRRSTGVTR